MARAFSNVQYNNNVCYYDMIVCVPTVTMCRVLWANRLAEDEKLPTNVYSAMHIILHIMYEC